MNLEGIDASGLTDDGDTLELSDRFRLRLKIEHDPDIDINHADCYGTKSKYAYDYRDHEYRHRPDGFTGRARKFEVDRGLIVWWEPYNEDGWWDGLTKAEQDEHASAIRDLIIDGFVQVGLELEELITDSIGGEHWTEIGSAWIGGVDSFYPELIGELASELPDVEVDA